MRVFTRPRRLALAAGALWVLAGAHLSAEVQSVPVSIVSREAIENLPVVRVLTGTGWQPAQSIEGAGTSRLASFQPSLLIDGTEIVAHEQVCTAGVDQVDQVVVLLVPRGRAVTGLPAGCAAVQYGGSFGWTSTGGTLNLTSRRATAGVQGFQPSERDAPQGPFARVSGGFGTTRNDFTSQARETFGTAFPMADILFSGDTRTSAVQGSVVFGFPLRAHLSWTAGLRVRNEGHFSYAGVAAVPFQELTNAATGEITKTWGPTAGLEYEVGGWSFGAFLAPTRWTSAGFYFDEYRVNGEREAGGETTSTDSGWQIAAFGLNVNVPFRAGLGFGFEYVRLGTLSGAFTEENNARAPANVSADAFTGLVTWQVGN